MQSIDIPSTRRLALTCAGLLKPDWTGLPTSATGNGVRARKAALQVIKRFGYLQLDTVSIAGARSHAIVLLSRLKGISPAFVEELLQPDEPLFEYWGHEACWIPMELYPIFAFRRKAFRHHPWWGNLLGKHPKIARNLRRRIRNEGPLRSLDLDGKGSSGWWNLKIARRVAAALWSSGEFAIRERRKFQRSFDLAERVIPAVHLKKSMTKAEGIKCLLLLALDGHGWATTNTLIQTWRLSRNRQEVQAALQDLVDDGAVVACSLSDENSKLTPGWIKPQHLELASRLKRVRPRTDQGVLLSPFDPVLWDRGRVQSLFKFNQILEIYKPEPKRIYGYYCLPVLAGEHLVARYDLKADRKAGTLQVLSLRFESAGKPSSNDKEAARTALKRYAAAVGLKPQ